MCSAYADERNCVTRAGGGDFYMAAKFGVFVHGVDLSVNMVTTALERASLALCGAKVGCMPSLTNTLSVTLTQQ
jgi:hypothetical protein